MIRFDSQIYASLSKETLNILKETCGDRERSSFFLREGYKSLYELVGASEDDHFIFTSSGAESVSQVLFSTYLNVTRQTGKNHFLCGSCDESSTLMGMQRLKELGCAFHTLPTDETGKITVEVVKEALSPRTALISLSLVNGLTGVLQDIREIAALCKDRGILLHLEATHAVGKVEMILQESGCDFLTFNGEQIHAPAGTGALFARSHIEISPLIVGGPEQAYTRGGRVNAALFAAFAHAARMAANFKDHISMETARLKGLLENRILEKIPEAKLLFKSTVRAPHLTSFAFPGVYGSSLLYALEQKGVFVCMGGGNLQLMHRLLKGCKMKSPLCFSALSFGLSYETTEEEVEKGSDIIASCVSKLQKQSSAFKESLEWD